jgi:hypothetical protein
MPVNNLIQLRRGTAAQWVTANPTLSVGEIGFETDTGKFKIGNGTEAWLVQKYAGGSGGAVISETAPVDPEEGSIWFKSNEGRSYIYYDGFYVDLTPSIKGADGANGVDGQNAFHPFLIG